MLIKTLNIIKTNNLILENSTIYVGFSGGSDSVTLLHILNTIKNNKLLGYNFDLVAVHINHNLYETSMNDQIFSENFCKTHDIKIKVYSEKVKEIKYKNKQTTEEAGRVVRKNIFNSLLKENDKIALAHHQLDNAESILMHLFRGTGLNGMLGMQIKNKQYIRPLLLSSKDEIYNYLKQNNLSYYTDETNFTEIYQRNKVRLTVIPYIKKTFNNNFINSITNTASLMKVDHDFLEQTANSELNNICTFKNNSMIALNTEKLLLLHDAIKSRIFQYSFSHLNKTTVDFSSTHIADIYNLLNKETGKTLNLPNNIFVKKSYDTIIFFNKTIDNPVNIKIDTNILTKYNDLYILISDTEQKIEGYKNIKTKIFYFDSAQNFYIRTKDDNDKLYLKSINGHKSLKKYFNENKIDELFRNDTKILSNDNNLIMILDKKLISTDNFSMGDYAYTVQLFNKLEE